MKLRINPFKLFTKFELALWGISLLTVFLSFIIPSDRDWLSLSASLIGVTALISGATIGGKALGKKVAINDSTKVVYRVARVMNTLHLFR